jgi:glycosyltransferase involved in cell wall biosynthesis
MCSVSVVIPAYNAEKTLPNTLKSIWEQTEKVEEVVVVDDGSADKTADVAKSWASKLPLKLIQNEKNLGLNASERLGVDACTSEWIFRLDADDLWRSSHVAALKAQTKITLAVLVTAPAFFV